MSDTETDARSDAETDARSDAGHDAAAGARFGRLTPSEAAQKRWAEERAREASADTSDTDAVPTDAEIVAALRRKAEKGDAAAARELREWRAVESTAMEGDLWMELLTPRERQFVRRVIERALKRTGDPITPDR
jgi:hypothetical protein